MNRILLLARKEWARFFGDRRMVISALLLPGALLYATYTFLAPAMVKLVGGNGGQSALYVFNAPPDAEAMLADAGLRPVQASAEGIAVIRDGIAGKSGDFLLVFPPDFAEAVAAYDVRSGEPAPDISLYYNSGAGGVAGSGYLAMITAALDGWESSMANKFDVNREAPGDLSDDPSGGLGNVLGMMLPMFLLIFIYQGAMSVTVESITGEKERGTLATVLITPITSGELAAGKLLGISVEALLCGVSGALGIMLSLPRFMSGMVAEAVSNAPDPGEAADAANAALSGMMHLGLKHPVDYAAVFLVIIATTCLITVIVALPAAFARTVKEAQLALSPLALVIMLPGIFGGMGGGGGAVWHSLIPLYNSATAISAIFGGDYGAVQVALTLASNLLFATLGAVVLARLLRSEKLLFPG